MKWVEGETPYKEDKDKIEAIMLQLQNDFRDTEYAEIDKFLANAQSSNGRTTYSEKDAKDAKKRIEKIIEGR